jgi:hypothetical protein
LSSSERNVRYHKKLKLECFEHYGGCHCFVEGCAEIDIDELELHHLDGHGNEDRADKLGDGLRSSGGWHFYLALKKLGYPPGLVVICIKHHDWLHGRVRKEERFDCPPGMDDTRSSDIIPF